MKRMTDVRPILSAGQRVDRAVRDLFSDWEAARRNSWAQHLAGGTRSPEIEATVLLCQHPNQTPAKV